MAITCGQNKQVLFTPERNAAFRATKSYDTIITISSSASAAS
jgi:hypothetical protein